MGALLIDGLNGWIVTPIRFYTLGGKHLARFVPEGDPPTRIVPDALCLWSYLHYCASEQGATFPTGETIVADTFITRERISEALHLLERAGFIAVVGEDRKNSRYIVTLPTEQVAAHAPDAVHDADAVAATEQLPFLPANPTPKPKIDKPKTDYQLLVGAFIACTGLTDAKFIGKHASPLHKKGVTAAQVMAGFAPPGSDGYPRGGWLYTVLTDGIDKPQRPNPATIEKYIDRAIAESPQAGAQPAQWGAFGAKKTTDKKSGHSGGFSY